MAKINEMIEIAVTLHAVTDHAILISDGGEQVWIPRSQLEELVDDSQLNKVIAIEIPEWLAAKHNFI